MKYICLMSGGIDSTLAACLSMLRDDCDSLAALYVDYRHVAREKEMSCLRRISDFFRSDSRFRNKYLGFSVYKSYFGSHYIVDGSMSEFESGYDADLLPGRNTAFVGIAQCHARSIGASRITIGVRNDFKRCPFPDCTQEWVDVMNSVIDLENASIPDGQEALRIVAPLINYNKEMVVSKSKELGLPIDSTTGCYFPAKDKKSGALLECGECISCRLAREVNLSCLRE